MESIIKELWHEIIISKTEISQSAQKDEKTNLNYC